VALKYYSTVIHNYKLYLTLIINELFVSVLYFFIYRISKLKSQYNESAIIQQYLEYHLSVYKFSVFNYLRYSRI